MQYKGNIKYRPKNNRSYRSRDFDGMKQTVGLLLSQDSKIERSKRKGYKMLT